MQCAVDMNMNMPGHVVQSPSSESPVLSCACWLQISALLDPVTMLQRQQLAKRQQAQQHCLQPQQEARSKHPAGQPAATAGEQHAAAGTAETTETGGDL
jgi:hypothetical protein